MQVTEVTNFALIKQVQERLQKERTGIHLSDLDLCLKASYFRKLNPQPLSLKQVVLFAIGFGVQEYMYPEAEKSYTLDGIVCSPDANKIEVKTTRESMKNFDPLRHENWTMRTKGYCKVLGTLDYQLDVVFIIPAEVKTFHFQFTQNEIDLNWEQMLYRKQLLETAFTTNIPPMPDFHPDWLCKFCEHSGSCYSLG